MFRFLVSAQRVWKSAPTEMRVRATQWPIMAKASGANATEDNDNGKARSKDQINEPGALKLDHMQPFKPILLTQFSTFCIFLHYPRGPIKGKGEFSQLQKWMRLRGFSAWDTQTGLYTTL